jgi:hypothetical protein
MRWDIDHSNENAPDNWGEGIKTPGVGVAVRVQRGDIGLKNLITLSFDLSMIRHVAISAEVNFLKRRLRLL